MPKKHHPGITVRHSRGCATGSGGDCTCKPSYRAWVWSPRDGKKIRKTFQSLSEAKGWRQDAASAVRKGRMRVPTNRTVEEVAREWIRDAKAGEIRKRGGKPYKPSVIRTYTTDLELHVLPRLGRIKLANLHRSDVQALIDGMLNGGASGGSVLNALNALRAVLRKPLRSDELVVNPCERLDLPEPAARRERAASREEATVLLEALPEEDRPLWACAFFGGLRRGELRALRVNWIDFDKNEIHVRGSWDIKEGPIEPKSEKGVRRVPMAETLRLYLLEQITKTGRRGNDLMFGRTAAEPFTPSHISKRAKGSWAAAVVGAFLAGRPLPLEIAPITLHECRHTYVSMMHAAGFSLEEIGDYVGHSSVYMVDRYRHLLDEQRATAKSRFDAYLGGTTGPTAGPQPMRERREPARLSQTSAVGG